MSKRYDTVTELAANPLDLLPEPIAVREAREWVGRVLVGWPEERVETARLLVSELVTNAVLHARTPISLQYSRECGRARFEVNDGFRAGPIAKTYAPDSPTGRGIRLVATLADDWGVTRSEDGKMVWFEIEPSERTEPVELASVLVFDLEEISTSPDPGDGRRSDAVEPELAHRAGDAGTGAGRAATIATDSVDVQFLGLPIEIYLEMEEHNDAVMRELELIVQSSHNPSSIELPRRLVELASQARAAFEPVAERLRSQVGEAIARGDGTVDLHMRVPRVGLETLLLLSDQLDELDRFCEEGDLLTLASPPHLRRLRTWFVQQVDVQMCGELATSWSGPDDGQAGEVGAPSMVESDGV